VHSDDPSWRELGPPTGVPALVKEELAAFYAAQRGGTVHRLPGQEGPPVEEAGTGTWGWISEGPGASVEAKHAWIVATLERLGLAEAIEEVKSGGLP
jgi:hypothetical protein